MMRFDSSSWVKCALAVAESADALSQRASEPVAQIAGLDASGATAMPASLFDVAFSVAAPVVAEGVRDCVAGIVEGLIELSIGLDATGKSYRETELANIEGAQLTSALAHTPFNGG